MEGSLRVPLTSHSLPFPANPLDPLNTSTLVQKLWNYCTVLRDDGMSYGDYVEQLTYLLFLKMADERSRPPYHQPSPIPAAYAWPALLAEDGDALFDRKRLGVPP